MTGAAVPADPLGSYKAVRLAPALDGFGSRSAHDGVGVATNLRLEQIAGLGSKLGPLLVQLPPSHKFDAGIAENFFAKPRHASWFTREAEALVQDLLRERAAGAGEGERG